MMQIGHQIVSIELFAQPTAEQPAYQPVLLWDETGATLVDTGNVGQFDQVQKAVSEAGLTLNDIKRVILTHQDIDHIGNVSRLLEANPGIEIWAHEDDIPVITGQEPLIKVTPERLAQMPQAAREAIQNVLDERSSISISRVLHDGDHLELHGGIQVIHTPGHTPGHICLYLPKEKLLLAADELTIHEGELQGPAPGFTPNMAQAIESMGKLADLPLDGVFCYHGGLYDKSPNERIREIIQSHR